MGMSSSQPQPATQGTMGSPTKNYGPVGGMVNSAQNQVNPQSSPTGAMNNLMGSLPGQNYTPRTVQNTAPQQNGPTQFTPGQGGMSGGMMPTNYMPPRQPTGNPGFHLGNPGQGGQPMGNPGFHLGTPSFMPMGNAGFMPMGNPGFMPMGFGQMPQQPQMPTFGGPRPGKAPQGGGNPQVAQTGGGNIQPPVSSNPPMSNEMAQHLSRPLQVSNGMEQNLSQPLQAVQPAKNHGSVSDWLYNSGINR